MKHNIFEKTGRLAEKDKIWKKQLKAEVIKQKIKDVNLLFGISETITSNGDIPTNGQYTKFCDIDTDYEDFVRNKEETAVLEGKEILGDQALPNNADNFDEVDDEIFPYEISPSVKTESSENVSLLKEMFGRIVTEHCQENLTCRLLHRRTVVKTMRSVIECKKKDKPEAVFLDETKSMQPSSRVSSLGYNIASTFFSAFHITDYTD